MGFTRRQMLTGTSTRASARRPPPDSPWRAHAGPACLAWRGIECRLCAERCDAGAIAFAAQTRGPARPGVDASRCTGCGECLPACPVNALVPEPA